MSKLPWIGWDEWVRDHPSGSVEKEEWDRVHQYPNDGWWRDRQQLIRLCWDRSQNAERKQFVVWRVAIDNNGEPHAEYCCPSHPESRATPTDPSTWSDIRTALNLVMHSNSEFKGIAFALTMSDPFVVIAEEGQMSAKMKEYPRSREEFAENHEPPEIPSAFYEISPLDRAFSSAIDSYRPRKIFHNWCEVNDKEQFQYGAKLDVMFWEVLVSRCFVPVGIEPPRELIKRWNFHEEVRKFIAFIKQHTGGVQTSLLTVPLNLPSVFERTIPIEWVIPGFIQAGAITAITGDSKHGKSTFVSALCYAIANGKPFLDFPAMPPREVIYLDRENPQAVIQDRFNRIKARDGNRFHYWSKNLGGVPDPSALLEICESMTPRPVVVVDSLVAFFEGDENNPNDMRRFFSQFDELLAMGVTIIVIHHTDKNSKQTYRGTSDFRASIDAGFLLVNEGGATGLDNLTLTAFASRVQVIKHLDFKYDEGKLVSVRAATHLERHIELIVFENVEIKIGDLVENAELLDAYTKDAIREVVNKMVDNGTLKERKGPNNSRLLSLPERK